MMMKRLQVIKPVLVYAHTVANLVTKACSKLSKLSSTVSSCVSASLTLFFSRYNNEQRLQSQQKPAIVGFQLCG